MNSNLTDECLARMTNWTTEAMPAGTGTGSWNGSSDGLTPGEMSVADAGSRDFESSSVTFSDTCGGARFVFPQDSYAEPFDYSAIQAIVVKITTLINSASDGSQVSLTMENCDGTKTVEATTTGVYVIETPLIVATVKRAQPDGSSRVDCIGKSTIKYELATLETYCEQDVGSLPQCESVVNATANSTTPLPATTKQVPSSAATPPATFFKLSLSVTMFSACATVAAALL